MEKKRKFRFPIIIKTILVIVIFGAVLSEIAMVYFSLVSSNTNKQTYKDVATNLSKTIALSIDVEKTKIITNDIISIYDDYAEKPTRAKEGTPEYEEYMNRVNEVTLTPDYIDIVKYLKDIKTANPNTYGVYLGYVDFDNKYCIYLAYDEPNELYPTGVVDDLYEEDYPILEDHMIGFVASIYQSDQGEYLVTAGSPIVDNNGDLVCYALVDISMHHVRSLQAERIVRLFIYLLATLAVISVIGIIIINLIMVKPIKILQSAAKSYDINDPEKTHERFSKLKVYVHDEIADLANSMKEMENDIYNKVNELSIINKELIEAKNETRTMTELANKDGLTGVRNKAAYDKLVEEINEQIANGEPIKFGVAMIDLNYLKNINDDFGHESGDAALIKLCNIICAIFAHSPVFRVGGDEFVVILRNRDYNKSGKLIDEFNAKIDELSEDDELTLAEKVSAAIGYSKYNHKTDQKVEDVFRRADKMMYTRKRQMKSGK